MAHCHLRARTDRSQQGLCVEDLAGLDIEVSPDPSTSRVGLASDASRTRQMCPYGMAHALGEI